MLRWKTEGAKLYTQYWRCFSTVLVCNRNFSERNRMQGAESTFDTIFPIADNSPERGLKSALTGQPDTTFRVGTTPISGLASMASTTTASSLIMWYHAVCQDRSHTNCDPDFRRAFRHACGLASEIEVRAVEQRADSHRQVRRSTFPNIRR